MIYRKFIILAVICSLSLGAAETENFRSINLNAGLYFSYAKAKILVGDDEVENSLIYPFLTLVLELELSDYLTVGVVAGYNQNHFNEPVDFLQLPLSLRLSKKNNHSMVFGCNLHSEPFDFGDFSLKLKGEFLFFKLFKQEWTVELPVVEGSAEVENSFFQLSANVLLVYQGMENLILYAGPQFNLLNGTIKAYETIEQLQGEQALEFKQKNLFGLMAGAVLALGSQWDLAVNVSMFAKTAVSVELFYIF